MVLDEILDYRSQLTALQKMLKGIPAENQISRGSLNARLQVVERKLTAAMREGSSHLLDALAVECIRPNWNGHGSAPVSADTIARARAMLATLSNKEQPTDINADPDGEVSFDWRAGDILLAVSLSADGRLSYIYRNGAQHERDTLQLNGDALPDKLRALIPRN